MWLDIHGPNPKQFNVNYIPYKNATYSITNQGDHVIDWEKIDGWFLWQYNGAIVHFIDQLDIEELPFDGTSTELNVFVFKKIEDLTNEDMETYFDHHAHDFLGMDCSDVIREYQSCYCKPCDKKFKNWNDFKMHYGPVHISCSIHSCDIIQSSKIETSSSSSESSESDSSDEDEVKRISWIDKTSRQEAAAQEQMDQKIAEKMAECNDQRSFEVEFAEPGQGDGEIIDPENEYPDDSEDDYYQDHNEPDYRDRECNCQ